MPSCYFYGGEREIRTLGRVLAYTRFPVVRLRPTQPSLHADSGIIPQRKSKINSFLKIFSIFLNFFASKAHFYRFILTKRDIAKESPAARASISSFSLYSEKLILSEESASFALTPKARSADEGALE